MARSVRKITGTRGIARPATLGPEKYEELMKEFEKETVTLRCGFCNGTGRDPFGLMSHLSNCQVCMGRGVVWVRPPVKECLFCDGTGIQPHSPNQVPCAACKGKGWVTAIPEEEAMECPGCGGRGFVMAPLPVHCLTCRGQGVVRRKERESQSIEY